MNYFVLAAGSLYLGAAAVYAVRGQVDMAGAFVAYAVANFFLMRVG